MQFSYLCMLTFVVFASLHTTFANTCDASLFPVYAGGSNQEFVNCFIFDEKNDFMIVGGNSTSGDFAYENNVPTGFLYAIDLNANWMWGNYYSSDSFYDLGLSTISGC